MSRTDALYRPRQDHRRKLDDPFKIEIIDPFDGNEHGWRFWSLLIDTVIYHKHCCFGRSGAGQAGRDTDCRQDGQKSVVVFGSFLWTSLT